MNCTCSKHVVCVGVLSCNTSQSCHEFDLSHTHACTCEECYQVRNTNKTDKCASDKVFCLQLRRKVCTIWSRHHIVDCTRSHECHQVPHVLTALSSGWSLQTSQNTLRSSSLNSSAPISSTSWPSSASGQSLTKVFLALHT